VRRIPRAGSSLGFLVLRDIFESVEEYGSRRMVQWGKEKLILVESGKVTRRRVERTVLVFDKTLYKKKATIERKRTCVYPALYVNPLPQSTITPRPKTLAAPYPALFHILLSLLRRVRIYHRRGLLISHRRHLLFPLHLLILLDQVAASAAERGQAVGARVAFDVVFLPDSAAVHALQEGRERAGAQHAPAAALEEEC
jgi:hypothetical protein